MITHRLENYRMVCSRRTEHKQRPETIDGLPVEESSEGEYNNKDDASASDGGAGGGCGLDGEDMQSDADQDDARVRTVYPPVAGTQCNRLPLGSDPVSVLGKPAHRLERTAEARYGRDYAEVAASCARVSAPVAAVAVALPMEQRVMCITSGNAVQIAKQVLQRISHNPQYHLCPSRTSRHRRRLLTVRTKPVQHIIARVCVCGVRACVCGCGKVGRWVSQESSCDGVV